MHGDFLCQYTGHIFQHSQHVRVRLMQLCADATVIAMDNLSQFLIICEPFLSNRDFFKLALANRNISDNNHRASAGSDFADFFKVFVLRKAKSGRSKDDTVFQFQTAVIDGGC